MMKHTSLFDEFICLTSRPSPAHPASCTLGIIFVLFLCVVFLPAFLDSLRPPGSPRVSRMDLSFSSPGRGGDGGGAGGSGSLTGGSATEAVSRAEQEALMNQELYARMDIPVDLEAERARDRSAYEKFLKINVKHVTDGQGVVAGVLLVTPNTVMFDPNVSDALVIEHGAEAYGVIAPVEFVVNAALYPDIAHMRLSDSDGKPDQPISDPIYYPTNCPLHRKYAILKEKARKQQEQKEEQQPDARQTDEQQATRMETKAPVDLDPVAGILAIAGLYSHTLYSLTHNALNFWC